MGPLPNGRTLTHWTKPWDDSETRRPLIRIPLSHPACFKFPGSENVMVYEKNPYITIFNKMLGWLWWLWWFIRTFHCLAAYDGLLNNKLVVLWNNPPYNQVGFHPQRIPSTTKHPGPCLSPNRSWPRIPRRQKLVGGWTNPSEKYESKWESFPNRGENKKYLKPPPRKSFQKHRLLRGAENMLLRNNQMLNDLYDLDLTTCMVNVGKYSIHWVWDN